MKNPLVWFSLLPLNFFSVLFHSCHRPNFCELVGNRHGRPSRPDGHGAKPNGRRIPTRPWWRRAVSDGRRGRARLWAAAADDARPTGEAWKNCSGFVDVRDDFVVLILLGCHVHCLFCFVICIYLFVVLCFVILHVSSPPPRCAGCCLCSLVHRLNRDDEEFASTRQAVACAVMVVELIVRRR